MYMRPVWLSTWSLLRAGWLALEGCLVLGPLGTLFPPGADGGFKDGFNIDFTILDE